MSANGTQTTIIRNGTLIDGTSQPAFQNDAVVVQGNRILSVGAVPPQINVEDRERVETIDATGKWIMPGLIEGHCHLSFGQPAMPGLNIARGTTSPRVFHHPGRPERPGGAAVGRDQPFPSPAAPGSLTWRCGRRSTPA